MCLFVLSPDDKIQQLVVIHVDDILHAHVSGLDEPFKEYLTSHFEIKHHTGPTLQYLSIEMQRQTNGDLWLDQCQYVKEITDQIELTSPTIESPWDPISWRKCMLMNAQLGKKEAATFAEVLGQLQYLASHTRIDITPVVSVLAPHLLTPTEGDQIMLARCLHYLKANPSMPLVFKADSNFTITAEADASWNLHPNGKSHMASAIYLGNALVHFKSKSSHKLCRPSAMQRPSLKFTQLTKLCKSETCCSN